MGIKTAPTTDHIDVEGLVKELLTACNFVSIGKNAWQALPVDNSKKVLGREAKSIGVRIQRIKPRYIPTTWFGKLMQRINNALEPVVEIEPLYVHARHHQVVTKVVVGRRKFSNPNDSLLLYPFRRDLREIFDKINDLLPSDTKTIS
ncbi:MAG: hypothetical protein M0P64_03535 [Candidatus Pacebacteria bacterium]|jgi:hypothetical protein|nr:hypothetical protein [Candidatus Paceibacterota bacterium]